jgi:hypothetical protein
MRKVELRSFEITPAERRLAEIGRSMMQAAVTEKDDAKSNKMAECGHKLCAYGAPYGTTAKDFTPEDHALIREQLEKINAA